MTTPLAYGFVGLENLLKDRVADTNVAVIREAINTSVAEHNRQVAAIMSEMVQPTTDYKVLFSSIAGGTLQPMDEWGIPKPVQGYSSFDVAFPMQGGGTAFGTNRVSRELMTVEEANNLTLTAMKQDANWLKRHAIAALLTKETWTYKDKDYGDLSIRGLANGDSTEYVLANATEKTDTHYVAQSAAVADLTNPFGAMYKGLAEHPENAGAEMVAYIPSNIKDDVMGLANFIEAADPNLQYGTGITTLSGNTVRGMGDEVLGRVDKMWIVEWNLLPDNYILAVARGSSKVLRMREYPASALQGLFSENASPDGAIEHQRFIRYCGFGAYNRIGAFVTQVAKGDTTYVSPAAYKAPLKV